MTTAGSSGAPLWSGRSSGSVDPIMVEMGESISLDIALFREDIQGSLAHAKMLQRMGILTDSEESAIEKGLKQIQAEIEAGTLAIRPELEDIHTHVENRLVELIGEPGRRLHTARSRNDQVAVDTHLFVRRASLETAALIRGLCGVLIERAKASVNVIGPAYTHMQVAQPVRMSHHFLSHFWAFLRDHDRFLAAFHDADRLPLGSGAATGVNYENDREFLRKELGFSSIYPNSMDAVSSRDHILGFLYACSVFMVHASRLAEEIVLWSTVEFGFIRLPDALTTGSSIMPQKKNPDLAELTRGKVGRVQGHLVSLLTNLKSLPLTYNRDLQEDRFPMLDAHKQAGLTARALHAMIAGMELRPERLRSVLEAGFATATDLADALVSEKRIPFRDAHHLVGALVGACAQAGKTLHSVDAHVRAGISEHFADDAFYRKAVDLESSADKKRSAGGTALARQEEQLKSAAAELSARINKQAPGA
ncbi:MAG: argininosuccinate lyase [Spirochaetia bacterium]|nr:argininosuccinate lyase [Spirochaetia bacterium]